MNMPKYFKLANVPTKIEKLNNLSKVLGKDIYIKRDDQTGTELSGNKVRKLEFAVKEALDSGCDFLITCGGIQSNHARATAAVAAKLGLGSYLVLRGSEDNEVEGNLFLDKILGAKLKFITPDEYKYNRTEIMNGIKEDLSKEGHKAYILPEGASNGIGSMGYFKAMEEILNQEKSLNIKFDAIISTVGSGGTYAGLYYANKAYNNNATIYGFNIAGDSKYFKEIVSNLFIEMDKYTGKQFNVNTEEIDIIDGYVGLGYALNQQKEIDFIKYFAKLEGIILDPVYTGKAMYGLVEEIKKGTFDNSKNILFIHTGGIFGWNKEARDLI